MPPKKVGKVTLKNSSKIPTQTGIVEIQSKYAPVSFNISDLPEDEKLKIGRLVEKLLEIGQKHENTLELLSKERIQHQQELQSLNQHIEEQVTIIENQIKLKDERLISLQNKEQMLTALVALYQKKLKHILELNAVTQHTDQSFQQKLLEKEHECESYQAIIKNHKLVLSTYEENAKQLQRSLQQQLLLEQQKTQEQQIKIQDLSQQVYLLQQDYQNLQYYYKLHSPNHELPKQLYSVAMNTSENFPSTLNPVNSTAKASSLVSTVNIHEYTPNFSVESPSFRSQIQQVASTKMKPDKSNETVQAEKQIEKASGISNGSVQHDFRNSAETTSTLGMTSIGQLATSRQSSKMIPTAINSSVIGKRDNDLYSDYSLMYHTSFSSQENSFLTNPSSVHHLDDEMYEEDNFNGSMLSQLSTKDAASSYNASRNQSGAREILNTSIESEKSVGGGGISNIGPASSSIQFQPPPLHSSYSKPPTPRVQPSVPIISNSANTSVNGSINLSDVEIVVHSDDFMSPHSKTEPQYQRTKKIGILNNKNNEISKDGIENEGMLASTKGIAISSPPLNSATNGIVDTPAVPRTSPNQKAYSLLNLLPAPQAIPSTHQDFIKSNQTSKQAVQGNINHEIKNTEVLITQTVSHSKKLSFSSDVNESKLNVVKGDSRPRKKSTDKQVETLKDVVDVGSERTNSGKKRTKKSSTSNGYSVPSSQGGIKKDAMVKLLDDIIESSPQASHHTMSNSPPKPSSSVIVSSKSNSGLSMESDNVGSEIAKRTNGGKLKTVSSSHDMGNKLESGSPKGRSDKPKLKQTKISKDGAVLYEPQLFDLLAEIELKESRYY